MVALFSPPSHLSSLEWLLEDPMSHEYENMDNCFGDDKIENLRCLPDLSTKVQQNTKNGSGLVGDGYEGKMLPHSLAKVQQNTKTGKISSCSDGLVGGGDEGKMSKKLDHNASERDRRKKINALYSTLRSLLPPEYQSSKLSIPNTVARVIDYIPQLQQEVESLRKKKEALDMSSSKNSKLDEQFDPKSKKIKLNQSSSSSSVVSATSINDREIMFNISTPKTEKRPISEVVMRMENEGFIIINAGFFESFDGRAFYNFHLQAQGSEIPMDVELLKKKVWPF